LGWRDRAATFDRLAADLIANGSGDYPQTSLYLSRARMLNLLGDKRATAMYELAREHLALQGQRPLLGIACFDQAQSPFTLPEQRQQLLSQAMELFAGLSMTHWHERAATPQGAPGATAVTANLPISRREVEVLQLIARGLPDRQIAEELFISERTVHAHVRNMLQKTDCDNRIQLANWARMAHLFDHDLPSMTPSAT
jgi:DNA-binding CsgD family transcriptional regulator